MQIDPDSVAPAGQVNIVLGLTRQTVLPLLVEPAPSTVQPSDLALLHTERPAIPGPSTLHTPLIKSKKVGQELLADAGAVTL